MKKKKILKIAAILIIAGVVIGGSIGIYMFNIPHRNVQTAKVDYTLTGSQIVAEYLTGKDAANKKYLSGDGNSKILIITGVISKISDDFNGQKVILLKESDAKAGVSAAFTKETSHNADDLQIGSTVSIKGVIRSGASFDSDLELYENVILEKCDVVKK
ncbi:MAG: hypothetical protein A2X05_18740 [Bacteroidetes bacterium GWE2_41_25]|nr:MAG: hypothetical protein A2X03_12140 [Bacteroidetes bacterium GWA2_40_15]OFX93657.1 MAG: hypothetical protein A2X06_05635 [Bacteroidetes bacterium GWC2_40_22]OFY01615.1 MAG: hypothetical protein A2X05_18740 [Bacteroidetes bacterium GWE2_41_25]OFY61092.1 MAG: hypothetical protein A2X04_00545 [Bacteroidetes bacterium GWF2_41_9]HAM10864.1 hypothetical protein [Bacteroidales bacterium]